MTSCLINIKSRIVDSLGWDRRESVLTGKSTFYRWRFLIVTATEVIFRLGEEQVEWEGVCGNLKGINLCRINFLDTNSLKIHAHLQLQNIFWRLQGDRGVECGRCAATRWREFYKRRGEWILVMCSFLVWRAEYELEYCWAGLMQIEVYSWGVISKNDSSKLF